jgi:hypothetical protein
MPNEPPDSEKLQPAVDKQDLPGLLHISAAEADGSGLPASQISTEPITDVQDNYIETKEPSELIFCIILSSMYFGLARYCWTPLQESRSWNIFVNIEGFFITIALLALLLGLRPYLSPSSLQISKHGLKYRGPYWPQRRTVNWSQIVHMYVSPELMLVIYRLPDKPKSIRPLLVHSVYLADREKIADSIVRFSPVEPTFVANPGLVTRTAQILLFAAIVIWIANILKG